MHNGDFQHSNSWLPRPPPRHASSSWGVRASQHSLTCDTQPLNMTTVKFKIDRPQDISTSSSSPSSSNWEPNHHSSLPVSFFPGLTQRNKNDFTHLALTRCHYSSRIERALLVQSKTLLPRYPPGSPSELRDNHPRSIDSISRERCIVLRISCSWSVR